MEYSIFWLGSPRLPSFLGLISPIFWELKSLHGIPWGFLVVQRLWLEYIDSKLTALSPFLSKKTSKFSTLPETNSHNSTWKFAPKGCPHLPTIHFQVLPLDVSFREGNRRDQRVFGKQPVKLLGWLVGKGRRCGTSYNSQVYPKQVSNEKRGPWLFSVYRGLYCPVTI